MDRPALPLLMTICAVTLAACGFSDGGTTGLAAGGSTTESAAPSSADLPDGTYRTSVTTDDLEARGIPNGPGFSGTWTLEVAGATFTIRCQPMDDPGIDCGNYAPATDLPDVVLESGTLVSDGVGLVTFDNDPPNLDYTASWRVDGDSLVLQATDDGTLTSRAANLTVNPLTRIG